MDPSNFLYTIEADTCLQDILNVVGRLRGHDIHHCIKTSFDIILILIQIENTHF